MLTRQPDHFPNQNQRAQLKPKTARNLLPISAALAFLVSAGKHLESYMEEMLFFVFLLRKMAVAVLIGEYRLTAPT